jgi:hypothetical protein
VIKIFSIIELDDKTYYTHRADFEVNGEKGFIYNCIPADVDELTVEQLMTMAIKMEYDNRIREKFNSEAR